MVKRFTLSVLTLILVLTTLLGFMPASEVKAGTETYNHIIPFTITDTSGAARTNVLVIISYDVDGKLVAYGLTNATATDTYVDSSGSGNSPVGSGTAYDYLMSTGNITVVIPSLPAYGSVTLNLYTGYSPEQTSFPIILGSGGYFTVADDGDLEPSDNFSIRLNDTYIDTDASADKTIFSHYDAVNGGIECFVSPTVSGNLTARIGLADAGYPVVGSTESDILGDVAAYDVPLPAGTEDGDLVIVAISTRSGVATRTVATPANWTELYQLANADNENSGAWYRIVDGDTSPVTFTFSGSTDFNGAYIAYRINRGTFCNTPVAGVALIGANSNPDPPNLVTGFGAVHTRYFAITMAYTAQASYPANYTTDTVSNGGAGTFIYSGTRNLTAASDDPGTYGTVSTRWISDTIAVEGAATFDVSALGVASAEYDLLEVEIIDNTGADWLAGWDNRIQIDIPPTNIDADLTQLPVLIKLSASSGIGADDLTCVFDELGANGLKIAVTEDDGTTEMNVEEVSWDEVAEEAELWTSNPGWVIDDAAGATVYLYYDADHADNAAHVGVTGSAPAELVWDANFVLVDHMNDNPDTSHVMDSTSNDNDGTKAGANTPEEVDGLVGDAQDFDPESEYITYGQGASLDISDAITVEVIAELLSSKWAGLIMQGNHGTWGDYSMYCLSSTEFCIGLNNAEKIITTVPNLVNGNEHYFSFTYDKDAGGTEEIKQYLNSLEINTGDYSTAVATGAYNLWVGFHYLQATKTWNGPIDEVRVSNIVRSPAWIKATYYSAWDNLIDFIPNSEGYLVDYAYDFRISVDGVIEDRTLGVAVPDSDADWTFCQAEVMPSVDSIEIDIDGTRQLYLAPNALISSDTIPDRESNGGDNDATITWGSNSDITVTGGSIMNSGSATSVGVTSFMMQGELTDIGTYAAVYLSFEYGLDTNYGYFTSESSVALAQTFSITLTGLIPNTTYYFRAVARSGIVYSYGEDITVTTAYSTSSQGSTTPLIQKMGIFRDYQETGDALICAEIVLTYPPYYPAGIPSSYFQFQLIDTDGSTLLGATPIRQWGDRPVAIYLNATVAAGLTDNAAYQIRIANISSENITNTSKTISSGDWYGSDLTMLDDWCRGVAWVMSLNDETSITDPYLKSGTSYGIIITDTAGGYFTTGIPNIAQIRPNLFGSAEYKSSLTTLSSDIDYNTGTSLTDRLGAGIVTDITTIGDVFDLSSDNVALFMILGLVLVLIASTVSQTGGFGALGALILCVPIIMAGMYLNMIKIAMIAVVAVIMVILIVRQFWWKTT